MADEPEFFSQHDAVREYSQLAGTTAALFVALGALAPTLPEPRAAIAAATLARRLGSHAAAWAELVPESVLLSDARAAAPDVAPVEAEWAAVHRAIDRLRGDLEDVLGRTSPVADAAARRLAREELGDLDAGLRSSTG
jgi:hypothetical protein